MSTVSIITITQHKRFRCLQNLYEIIKQQEYLLIKEWIIVEGSQNKDSRSANSKNIQNFINETLNSSIRIGFICPNTILPLSNLRNLANEHCNGDIIVCMDDDDYYPPMAVSHAVTMLNRYNRLIAGCSPMYMYDFFTETLYKFNGFHNNHSTNNCMAYRKQYLENHRYEEGLNCAEEYSFTNGFTEPMIQLIAEKCIVASIHDNTVDKTAFITQNPGVTEVHDKHISDLIPTEIFEKMRAAFLL